ncbi:MAG: asparaginase [Actinobacteria bacterium]|nr:asparaginase [Actinomycetota bacterium]
MKPDPTESAAKAASTEAPSDALESPFDAPVAAVWRGDIVESVHRGRYVVRNARGETLGSLGDPGGYVHLRSSAKPFQALPLVFSGAADAFGISGEEIAVACASHNAEPRHLRAVRSILRKAGLSENDLQSGAHPPMHAPTAARLATLDEEPRPIHGNCSGKHAGMLAVCAHAGWDPAGYRDPEGPLQNLLRRTVAKLCGLEPEEVKLAGDGCGVPAFAIPLEALALGFARLVAGGAEDFPEDLLEAVRKVRDVMRAHPYMIAGTGRFDTRLMQETDLVAKSGAEAVFAAASLGEPGPEQASWGLALKISDGAGRAVAPAVAAAIAARGVRLSEEIKTQPIIDLHGETVGKIAPPAR